MLINISKIRLRNLIFVILITAVIGVFPISSRSFNISDADPLVSSQSKGSSSNLKAVVELISSSKLEAITEYGNYTPPNSGTWHITHNTRVENLISVLNGSILIDPEISVEFWNCSLKFASSFSTHYEIQALTNSSLLINNCTLESATGYPFTILSPFGSNSSFQLINSSLRDFNSLEIQAANNELSNIKMYNSFNQAIKILETAQTNITNLTLETKERGISILGNYVGVQIENTIITGSALAAISTSSASNVSIRNVHLRGNGSDYESAGIDSFNLTNSIINNITVQNFYKNIAFNNCSNITLEKSLFEQTSDSHAMDGELQFDDSCFNIIIKDNIIKNLTYDGIEIYRSTHFLIHNNTFIETGAGLHFNNPPVSHITITNNTFINSDAQISGADHIYFYGNDFQGGKLSMSNSTDSIIKYNVFDNPSDLDTSFDLNNTNITAAENTFRSNIPTIPGLDVFPLVIAFLFLAIIGKYVKNYSQKRKTRSN